MSARIEGGDPTATEEFQALRFHLRELELSLRRKSAACTHLASVREQSGAVDAVEEAARLHGKADGLKIAAEDIMRAFFSSPPFDAAQEKARHVAENDVAQQRADCAADFAKKVEV